MVTMTAFDQGRKAYNAGVPLSSNPKRKGAERREWVYGWQEEQRIQKKKRGMGK